MNETHQFLRYVLPGASFTIEAPFLLFLLLPEWTLAKLGKVVEAGLWSAIVTFLGMGGIGFLFSIVHHLFREYILVGHDHRPVIERLRKRNILKLLNVENGYLVQNSFKPDRHEAWVIVNALWHQKLAENPRLSGANPRAESLANLVHSIGTAMWGALFAAIIAFWVALFVAGHSLETIGGSRFNVAVVLAIVLCATHFLAYMQISYTAKLLIAEIIEDTLKDSFLISGIAVQTHVDMRAVKKHSKRKHTA